MCGISAVVAKEKSTAYWYLLKESEIRGQDGTGITRLHKDEFFTIKTPDKASKAFEEYVNTEIEEGDMIVGQNRLAIFGLGHENDQPITTERYALVHNGNLDDFERVFTEKGYRRELQVDSELILRVIEAAHPKDAIALESVIAREVFSLKGNMACILLDKKLKLLVAFTKYKPLYHFTNHLGTFFFSTPRIGKRVFLNDEKDFVEMKTGSIKIVKAYE